MGAGVVKPEQNGIRIHIHTGRNPANMGNSSTSLKCEECMAKFSHMRKKLPCKDCGRIFCSVCCVPAGSQCKKCYILLSGNFTRQQLKQWKPKDLKALLHKHDVNTSKCREKDDLVDLIFSYFGGTSSGGVEQGQSGQQNQSGQQSNVAGASQSEYSHQRGGTQFGQAGSGSFNQSGTDTQSGYAQNSTETRPTGSGTSEPAQNVGTQSNQTGSGSDNQSGTGMNQSEPEERNESDLPRIKLEDIRSEEHIEQLSIKCLKRILLNNFVDYKGCCERWELQERVKRLWSHDQINKQKADQQRKISDDPSLATSGSPNSEDDICKICMDAAIDCVLLECGHMVTCTQCGKRLSECPICRQYVVRAVHIFKA